MPSRAEAPAAPAREGGAPPRSRIHYLVPDYDHPSWGTAMLYEHVRLLRETGFDARVVHERAPFRLSWIDHDVPVAHLDAPEEPPVPGDLLVVPETLAASSAELRWPCRRVVFVQGSFLLARGLRGARGFAELGFESALAVLPHVARVVENHFGLAAEVVPPFVAPYFFRSPEEIRSRPRSRTILLAAKPEYRAAGFPDYDLFRALLAPRLERGDGWRLTELHGLRHSEVAEVMADASFLVNLNSHEAFNSTVPEAMAAGCVPVCYDAFGGQDYLVDGVNAFVFPNHHVFPLAEKLLELLDAPPEVLEPVRLGGRETAGRYTRGATREALERAFTRLVGAAAGAG
ncbi:MAG TPA: glycosyltransferase [Thermoanaerobaculia bacterium]|nr:glycosyltransferase [Thermoanaerobaculia bacterium]